MAYLTSPASDASTSGTTPASAITQSQQMTVTASATATTGAPGIATTRSCRKKILAWLHFQKTSEIQASCELCGDTIKTAGNTTNLMTVSESNYTM